MIIWKVKMVTELGLKNQEKPSKISEIFIGKWMKT